MQSRRKPHNFHRFVLSDDVNQISVRIPNKFIREHRRKILVNSVSLIVSDNKVWSLGWMISGDGKLWLQQGWPEFAEHYCLKSGHLLLFNHRGKSVFHVRIFDRSSCEINYQPTEKFPKSVKDIDDQPMREDDQIMGMPETEVLNEPTDLQDMQASEKGNEQRSSNRALKAAKSFKSDNPYYSVTRKACYENWGLYVPRPFMRRYLLSGDEKCVNCVFQVSDGRFWGPIMCRNYKNYGKVYGPNWNKFRDENHLGVGDVCVVELINEVEKVLKVTIFRNR